MQTNMYGFNAKTPEGSVSRAFPAGIIENVVVSEVKFASMSEGRDPLLQIEFKEPGGGTLRWVVWDIDPQRIRDNHKPGEHKRDNKELGFVKGTPITADDRVRQEFANWNSKLKHLATKFVSPEEAEISASSYADFCRQYVNLMNKADLTTPLRMKVVLNGQNYASVPLYAPFVELMTVEKTALTIGRYDKIVATSSSDSVSDTGALIEAGKVEDDLPF